MNVQVNNINTTCITTTLGSWTGSGRTFLLLLVTLQSRLSLCLAGRLQRDPGRDSRLPSPEIPNAAESRSSTDSSCREVDPPHTHHAWIALAANLWKDEVQDPDVCSGLRAWLSSWRSISPADAFDLRLWTQFDSKSKDRSSLVKLPCPLQLHCFWMRYRRRWEPQKL